MIFKELLTFLVLGLTCVGMSSAASARDADPLFTDDSVLEAKLVAPLDRIMEQRDSDEELPGTFELFSEDGSSLQVPVQVRTRGNYRHGEDVCQFAPLRLNFKKSDVKNTALHKQDKVKLVTHCQNRSANYEQAVIREYLVYRVLNVFTDFSFRARLLRISYVDSDSNDSDDATFAILIESDKRLAKRLNLDELEVDSVQLEMLNRKHTNLISIYEYIIGNLDFSPIAGPEGKPCCHNFALFIDDKKMSWAIPYDFDMTGFVESLHYAPNPKYKQRNVRQRVYRGRCYNQELLPATLQIFRDKRADALAVIAAQTELKEFVRKRIDSYVQSFYDLLEKEEELLEQFAEACI
jgi:hypothetical protein